MVRESTSEAKLFRGRMVSAALADARTCNIDSSPSQTTGGVTSKQDSISRSCSVRRLFLPEASMTGRGESFWGRESGREEQDAKQ